jgi:hypothetical protein
MGCQQINNQFSFEKFQSLRSLIEVRLGFPGSTFVYLIKTKTALQVMQESAIIEGGMIK